MTSERLTEPRHSQVEMMLKDLIRCPSILSRFRVMNILAICQDLALARVERPNKDDFVLRPSAVGSSESIPQGLSVAHAKLEGDSLLGEAKGFGSILL